MAGRVHRTDLTDKMKERLAQCENEYREKGDPNDNTRLIISWKGANEKEVTLLKSLLQEDPEYYKKVNNILNKHYETFGVFKKKVLTQTVQNIKNAERNAKARVEEGILLLLLLVAIFLFQTQTVLLCLSAVRKEQQAAEGPFASGVKATSNPKPSPPDNATKAHGIPGSSATILSKCANTTFMGKNINTDDGTVVGGKKAATVSVSGKSVFAGSFNGQPVPQDGAFGANAQQIHQYSILQKELENAIGGGLVFAQADFHYDACRNKRGSLHITYSPLCIVPKGGFDVRLSTADSSFIVTQVEISKEFCKPDKVLEYILDRMDEACPQLKSRAAKLSYLRNTSRYSALFGNLQKLAAAHSQSPNSKTIRFEFRQRFLDDHGQPFMIAPQLVHKSEDNLFFGAHSIVDKKGTTHVYMEFKEKDAVFRPVDHSGKKEFTIGTTSPFGNKTPMSPVNEEASDDDDDDFASPPATISTPMKKAMKKGKMKAMESHGTTYRDADDEASSGESTISSKKSEMDVEEEDDDDDSSASDVSATTLELAKALKNMGRKKRNSMFGISTSNSHRSGTTRGSTERNDKRKSKVNSNDNSSKASSKHSKKSSKSSKSKSNATFTCFNQFDECKEKQN